MTAKALNCHYRCLQACKGLQTFCKKEVIVIINIISMKKIVVMLCALGFVAAAVAQTPEVKIKKGKATMDEAYYYQLKQKADAYEALEQQLADTERKLSVSEAEARRNGPIPLKTFNDSASYAIGKDIVNSWQQQKLGINIAAAGQSMIDMARGTNHWDQKVMSPLLQRFQQNFERREKQRNEEMMASLEKNKADGAAFLAKNAESKAIYTTPSGLQYKVLKRGDGKKPTAKNTVKVHYTGTLIDGTKFDSSVDRGTPAEFPVSAVIPGWTEGLQLMNEGGHYIFYIPYNLGYGEQLVGDIPPGSTLIFDVQLLEIVK